MKQLDLQPDHLRTVHDILQLNIPDREVWAFGSRVKGNAGATSDLDLAIIGASPLPFVTLSKVKDAFSSSSLPIKVDISEFSEGTDAFRTFKQWVGRDIVVLQHGPHV